MDAVTEDACWTLWLWYLSAPTVVTLVIVATPPGRWFYQNRFRWPVSNRVSWCLKVRVVGYVCPAGGMGVMGGEEGGGARCMCSFTEPIMCMSRMPFTSRITHKS